jgi:prepilin-type N-terminal cleavage/methylation domain-containing protein
MHTHKGFTLIELVITMALIAVISVAIAGVIKDNANTSRAMVAAQQLHQHTRASETYVRDNYTVLLAAAAGGPVSVTTAQLQTANLLPASFATNNVYGQTTRAIVRRATATTLEAIVVTEGGSTIPDQYADDAAERVTELGSAGGFTPAATPTTARGAGGSWSVNLGTFSVTPGAGHLAANLSYANSSDADKFLHRAAEPGRPELNTMSTDLNMGANDITAVDKVTATGLVTAAAVQVAQGNSVRIGANTALYADSSNTAIRQPGSFYVQHMNGSPAGLISGRVDSSDWVVAASGMSTPGAVYASNWLRTYGATGWYSETYGGGWYMTDPTWIRAYNGKNIYTPGTVLAGTLESSGRVVAGEHVELRGVASVGAGCSPNGLVGREANGRLLSCVSGVWLGAGGIYDTITVFSSTLSTQNTWAYAYCPAGYRVTGGGWNIFWRKDGSSETAPGVSRAWENLNAWGVLSTVGDNSMYAIATCTR